MASIFYMALGLVFGRITKHVVTGSHNFRNGIIAAAAFGNNGDLINAIILSLGDSPPFAPASSTYGLGLNAIYCVLPTFTTFSIGQSLVSSDFEHVEEELTITEAEIPPIEENKESSNYELIDMNDETLKSSEKSVSFSNSVPSTYSLWSKIKKYLIDPLSSAPNIAMILSVVIANISVLKSLLVSLDTSLTIDQRTSSAPLGFLYEIMASVGVAGISVGVINIGCVFMRLISMFIKNYREKLLVSEPILPKSTYLASVSIAAIRLMVFPVIGILFWELLLTHLLSFVPVTDKMLRFILMIQSATPTAQLMINLSQIYDPKALGLDMACVSLLQYFLVVITMSGWLVAIFYLLFKF